MLIKAARATLAGLVGMLLLVGCSQPAAPAPDPMTTASDAAVPTPSEDAFLTADEVMQQLPEALDQFDGTFPDSGQPGAVLKRLQNQFRLELKNLAADSEATDPGVFEKGYAESVVVMRWLCEWEGEFVAAHQRGDAEGVRTAGDQLSTYYNLNYTTRHVDDPEHAWQRTILEPALHGDITAMAAEICPV